jgi:outer membrane protein assembly factor BamA
MRLIPWTLFVTVFFSASFLPAQCVDDQRSNKNAGILIIDFTITGTQTITSTDLAAITSDMIGSCFDDDSEAMEECVRASFQDRGYFKVEVKSLSFKPRDPLGVPKPVTLEGEVSEGARYKLATITFVENHAFSSEKLRQQFPLKSGDLFERGKVAGGLQSLRKLYGTKGFLDFTAIPETNFGSNATVNLNISVQEGAQYHMGKLDIVADKEVAARLHAEWKLAEGDVYDHTYIDQFFETNWDSLPLGFSRANVHTIQNCPDTVVEVRLIVDPAQDNWHPEAKNVPCKDHHDVSK